jgi:ribose 5-phosphate isomerase B
MKIYIGSDHAGFLIKEFLGQKLNSFGYEVVDCGPEELNQEDDYPDYISKVASEVSSDSESRGLVLGFSGQGEAMVANRFKNVRCAVFYGGDKEILELSRLHNDANILSLGAHFLTKEEALDSVTTWLSTSFSEDERHIRRIKKIEEF